MRGPRRAPASGSHHAPPKGAAASDRAPARERAIPTGQLRRAVRRRVLANGLRAGQATFRGPHDEEPRIDPVPHPADARGGRRRRARHRGVRLPLREGRVVSRQRPGDLRELPRDGGPPRRVAGGAAPPGRHLQRLPHAGRTGVEVRREGAERLPPLDGVHPRGLPRGHPRAPGERARSSRGTAGAATPTWSRTSPTARASPASAATPPSATSAEPDPSPPSARRSPA